jgi:malonyl-CoA O-methyltransferase
MTTSDRPFPWTLNKQRVRAAFNRAASNYDRAAVVQREIGKRLLERLTLTRLNPMWILDIGAGTGAIGCALSRRYRRAQIIDLDIAEHMLDEARRATPYLARWFGKRAFICGEAEQLPLDTARFDLVLSNLTLQWCNDPDRVFAECRRVLRPGGLLMFSTLGPDTLKELRASWSGVDGYTHVHGFIDMHDLGDALMRNGFSDTVMEREDLTVTYRQVADLMRDLKTIGAHNSAAARAPGLTGKDRLETVMANYELYRRNGLLPATHEVIYGHCWASTASRSVQRRTPEGAIAVPIDSLRKPNERDP